MNTSKIKSLLLLLMLGATMPSIISSCSSDEPGVILGGGNNNSSSNNDVINTAEYESRLEVPAISSGKGIYFVVHEAKVDDKSTDKVMDYCLEYDSAHYHSRWVAFSFDSKTNAKNVSRQDAFDEDPSLPQTCRLNSRAYSGSGYDRGHLCASNDRLFSTEANRKTFYMSNMSPQMPKFNQGYWVTLEAIVAGWGRSNKFDKLYVTKGGTIDQLYGELNTTNSQGEDVKVAIPKYYFMAVLGEKNGTYQAVGFWMEHKEYAGYSSSNNAPRSLMKTHAMSIDELEKKTGIDFFHNLPDNIEEQVEANYNELGWDW